MKRRLVYEYGRSRIRQNTSNTAEQFITLQKKIKSTSKHFQTLHNTSEHLKTHQNASKHFRHFNTLRYTSEHFRTLPNTSKYFKTHKNTSKFLSTLQYTSKYLRALPNTSKTSKYFKNRTVETWLRRQRAQSFHDGFLKLVYQLRKCAQSLCGPPSADT